MEKCTRSKILMALSIAFLSSLTMFLTHTYADGTELIDTVSLTVPVACTMSGTGQTSHNAILNPGTYSGASGSEYEAGIGKTTLTTYCNDNNGFSIYAIGFTNNLYEGESHTKLIGQNTNQSIGTKVYTNGDTDSNWSMKVTKVDNPVSGDPITYNPDNMSIQNSFNSWHEVPDIYTKVAQYNSSTTDPATTDTTLGAKLETTYATYISSSQPADTYTGQVKYTMVHPSSNNPKDGPMLNCPAGNICYSQGANDTEGTMANQAVAEGGEIVKLYASNYSRRGYGFAGWSDKYDYDTNPEANFYGTSDNITVPENIMENGLPLYAVWVKSTGYLQNSSMVAELCGTGDNSLVQALADGTSDLTSVTALTDQRDDQTYAIAKLADGKCWMIENLRLDYQYTDRDPYAALSQGYGSGTYGTFDGLAYPEDSSLFANVKTRNSRYYPTTTGYSMAVRIPRYNNDNTASRDEYSDGSGNTYSYGNYYNYPSSIADIQYHVTNNESADSTSLCPFGWRLPMGGDKDNEANNDLWKLIVERINNGVQPANYENEIRPYYTGDPEARMLARKLRAFPTNLVYGGSISNGSRGSGGMYWTSTSTAEMTSYSLAVGSNIVRPGLHRSSKYQGLSVRCLTDLGNE